MRRLIFILPLLLLLFSCRSVKQSHKESYVQKDSVTYESVTTVDLDTTVIKGDTASFSADFIMEMETMEIQKVQTDQGSDIILHYEVEKTTEGARVKVKAVTKPKEVIQQTKTIETTKTSSEEKETVIEDKTKIKRGISLAHLWWVIPVLIVAYIIYKKWPLIKTFLKIM